MADTERLLLLTLADWVAEREEELAKGQGTTSNWAATIRNYARKVREESGLRDRTN